MKRIAFITDIHLDEDDPKNVGVDSYSNWELILKDVASRNIDEIVFGGDIGAASAYPWFFKSVANYPFKFIIGNHDRYADAAAFYQGDTSVANALCYTQEDNDFRYIFLDTSTEQVSEAQFKWLKEQLVTDKTIIIFVHHPVLGINTAVDSKYPLHNRKFIAGALLSSNKQIVIFCGHCHMPDIQISGNVKQYVTPAASYQITKLVDHIEPNNSTFGYRIISLEGAEIHTALIMYQQGGFIETHE
jgi:Icc protein